MQLLCAVDVLLLTLTLCYSQPSTDETSEIMSTVTASGVITSTIYDTSTVVTSTTTETASTTTETGTTASPTVEAGTSESPTIETGTSESPTVETGTSTSPAVETGTSVSPAVETGTTASPAVETGTSTSPTVETGTSATPAVETGTSASPAVETGTAASTTTQTGATVSPTVETVTTASTTTQTGTTASTTIQTGSTASTTTQTVTTTSTITQTVTTTSTTTQTDTTTSTTTSIITTTTITVTTTSTETTMTSATNPTTTTTTTTTAAPPALILLSQCNFNSASDTSCLSNGQNYVNITDGTQFEQDIRRNSSLQPIAPISGAPSFVKSNSYSERCQFPYNLTTFANINATWEMWFCFNDQCPASAGGNAISCSADSYGLIPFMSGDANTNKSISLQTRPTSRIDGESNQQCLLYFYYITPGNGTLNQNATIVTYATDNLTGNRTQIDSVSWSNMGTNSWQNRSTDFNFSSNTYTVTFIFTTYNLPTDRSIYFAVDNIELYNNNCTYLDQINNAEVPTPIDPPSDRNLGLILGLSLGLGIPALLGVVAGAAYVYKQKRRKDTYLTEGYALDDRLTYPSYQYVDNENDNDVSTTVF